jgi:hypothetical protein
MLNAYLILLLFVAVNLTALFYRRSFSINAAVYLATLVLLYASFLFLDGIIYNMFHFWWKYLKSVATLLYCLASLYCIIKEKRILLLSLAFVNLFLCHVVINHTTGGNADMTFSMFLDPDNDERVVNTVSDTAGIALVFMGIGLPIFLLVRFFMYIGRNRSRDAHFDG